MHVVCICAQDDANYRRGIRKLSNENENPLIVGTSIEDTEIELSDGIGVQQRCEFVPFILSRLSVFETSLTGIRRIVFQQVCLLIKALVVSVFLWLEMV